jgi:hypothetical protein
VEEKIRIVLEGLRGEANIMLDRERQGREASPSAAVIDIRRRICLPAHDKSAACLSHRLWIRPDLVPHDGIVSFQ